jgi:GPH family glycoside/pentoside/hexuronide:cation symporter
LWWAPPLENQILLTLYVALAFMLSDTLQTLVSVPFYSLTPEMTPDYDERTSLTGYRMLFNLLASLVTAVAAPMIVDLALRNGLTQGQGYLIVASLFGGLGALPFLVIFLVVREEAGDRTRSEVPLREALETAWENVPFRFATGLYVLNWLTFDLVALMLPFFLTYWIAQGDLLASMELLGEPIALESVILGLLLVVALAALPLWTWLARRFSKRSAYIVGMSFWAVVQASIILVQPGETSLILALTFLAGLSVSTAHVLPEAIFPDVIEWDELRTRRRHEGMYYGAKNFLRKMTSAVAIFLALQALGWFGYRSPDPALTRFAQSETTVMAIRLLTGPAGSLLLTGAILVAWFYPLTRERHQRIRRLLLHRERRQ